MISLKQIPASMTILQNFDQKVPKKLIFWQKLHFLVKFFKIKALIKKNEKNPPKTFVLR